MQGYYPTPMTPQMMMAQRMGMSKMNTCFTQPSAILERPDLTNRGGIIHNNLGDRVMAEHITEYKINIDSKDRDISYYPSPFKMKSHFNDPLRNPNITKKFKNVKYITLDYVILPRTTSIDVSHVLDPIPQILPTDSSYSIGGATPESPSDMLAVLSNHKYLILRVDEIASDRKLGTSALLDRNTFILYYDGRMGLDNTMWKCYGNTVIFQNSALANISVLTFTLFDEFENEIVLTDQNGNNIITSSISGLSDNFNEYYINNSSMKTASYTNTITQSTYCFTFGVVENELNTQTTY
jgi:hypothetical protein